MKPPLVWAQVSPQTRAALERMAKDDDRSLSSYIRIVLEKHIARRQLRGTAA